MENSGLKQKTSMAWPVQMAELLTEQQRRLRDLLELQRSRLEELESQLGVAQQIVQDREKSLQEKLAALETERDILQKQSLEGANPEGRTGQEPEQKWEELQRRYELALEDIRRLEAENQELRQQLEERSSAQQLSAQTAEENWEAFKRRILQSLETEEKETAEKIDENRRQERVQIQEVIAKTEAALAAKDQELDSLRHLLENQSANLGAMAVGAAAVGELLDQDEIIRQQRETLQRLETEWREKLRQAEVELSLERAALARQRAELEEKLRQIEDLQTQGPSASAETAPKKPAGGWRNFFGLNEGRKK